MLGRSRFSFLLVGVVAVTALPREAESQTTSGTTITMSTYQPVVRTKPHDIDSTDPTIVNVVTRADCKDTSVKYTFSLSMTGYQTTMLLQAWAGPGDCSGQFTSATAIRTCWKVGDVDVVSSGSAPTGKATFTVPQMFGLGNDLGVTPLIASCDARSEFYRTKQSFNLQFFLLSDQYTVAAKVAQPIYYALQGPIAPTGVSAGFADSSLHVRWTPITKASSEVDYKFFCAPNEWVEPNCYNSKLEQSGASFKPFVATAGAAGAESTDADAGLGGDVGAGGTGSGGIEDNARAGNAGSAGVTTGIEGSAGAQAAGGSGGSSGTTSTDGSAGTAGVTIVTYEGLTECGLVKGRATSKGYTDQVLDNGTSYAVAVAAVDRFGNIGDLSTQACATPEMVDTFFDTYRSSGGKAGGGFCNIDMRRRSTAFPVLFGSLLLLGWARRKRNVARHFKVRTNRHVDG